MLGSFALPQPPVARVPPPPRGCAGQLGRQRAPSTFHRVAHPGPPPPPPPPPPPHPSSSVPPPRSTPTPKTRHPPTAPPVHSSSPDARHAPPPPRLGKRVPTADPGVSAVGQSLSLHHLLSKAQTPESRHPPTPPTPPRTPKRAPARKHLPLLPPEV